MLISDRPTDLVTEASRSLVYRQFSAGKMSYLVVLLVPAMVYRYRGWQMARYLSMEKARMVRTEA